MDRENKIPWYEPGPEFKLTDAAKEFFLLVLITFVLGGINSLIAFFEVVPDAIPDEYIAYVGLIIAFLKSLATIIQTYKNGIEQ